MHARGHIAHIVYGGEQLLKIFFCAAAMLSLLFYPSLSIQSARDALLLWSSDIVPSLFPYMVLCRMISSRLKARRIPAWIASVSLGFVGGSPSGSAVLSGYSLKLPRKNMLALCSLTGTLSPMFLLGTAASWLKPPVTSYMLLASHMGGALLAAGFFLLIKDHTPAAGTGMNIAPTASDESDAITQSIHAIFYVGGCIVFYSVLSSLICRLPWINRTVSALIHAFMEVSGGMHSISLLPLDAFVTAILLSAASAFSSLSVISQNLVFLSGLGIRLKDLIFIGILRALFASCLMFLQCLCVC